MRLACALAALAAGACASAARAPAAPTPWPQPKTSSLFLSAGFTSDMVLKSAPNSAAVYGLVVPSARGVTPTVSVTLLPDAGAGAGAASAVVLARVATDQGPAGTHCDQMCYAAGYQCSVGDVASAGESCPYGCQFALATDSYADCAALCDSVQCGSEFNGVPLACGGCATDAPSSAAAPAAADGDQCRAGCANIHNASAPAMSWKALLPPTVAGGSYTLSVACESGCAAADAGVKLVLERVAFGEIFFCAGQSNMVLNLQQTYEYKDKMLEQQVAAGAYSNIRVYNWNAGVYPVAYGGVPAWATTHGSFDTLGGAWLNSTYAAQVNDDLSNFVPQKTFRSFSAPCWYFAQKLTDLLGAAAPPIGLILASMGGVSIESYSANETIASCTETNPGSSGAPVSKIYYGSVTPFMNTTVSGFVWYQGENNCGGTMGSPLDHSGYACSLAAMIRDWRAYWSATPGTTDALAPFGLFTIHPQGCEGAQQIGYMRHAQTANVGHAPNDYLPNVLVAQAFDAGDPWANGNSWLGNAGCEEVDPKTGQFGPNCLPFDDSRWDEATKYIAPLTYNTTIQMYMGGLHPRLKSPLAKRLALAVYNLKFGGTGALTGPTIAGCRVAGAAGTTLVATVTYDAALLRGDTVSVSPYDANMANWGIGDSPTFMACIVREDAPPGTACNEWIAGAAASAGPAAVTATFEPPFQARITALRYGWPLQDLDCCPQQAYANGWAECPAAACPIKLAGGLLPGNPFFANVTNGKCVCNLPQTCDA